MTIAKRLIEIEEQAAIALEKRAAERGLSVPDLVAEMTELAASAAVPAVEDVAELDRRWLAVAAGEQTIAHEDAVRWLQTWGTPAFSVLVLSPS
jgi:hypothetical protein